MGGKGAGSTYASKTSSVGDCDLFGFFGEQEALGPTPGQGMPASFTGPQTEANQKWQARPIGPLAGDGSVQGWEDFNPDSDDAMMLPPTITLDQQRRALMREAAMRPLSNGRFGHSKSVGKTEGIWNTVNPPPQRTGAFKPSGNVAFGISDAYWTAASCGAQPAMDAVSVPNALAAIDNAMTSSGMMSIGNGPLPMSATPMSMPMGGGGGGGAPSSPMDAQLASPSGRTVSAMGTSEW